MTKIVLMVCAALMLFASRAAAQEALPCTADEKRLCAGIEPGRDDSLRACFRAHISELSDACLEWLAGPPTAQPDVTPPTAQPDVTPPTAQPDVTPPIAQPDVTPPIAQPDVRPPIAQPDVTPPIAQPDVRPPIAQPDVTPGTGGAGETVYYDPPKRPFCHGQQRRGYFAWNPGRYDSWNGVGPYKHKHFGGHRWHDLNYNGCAPWWQPETYGTTAARRAFKQAYNNPHVRWCLNRYRSYDPRTNTYVGYDGDRHRCRGPN